MDPPLFGFGFASVVLPWITGPTKFMSLTHPQTFSLVGTEQSIQMKRAQKNYRGPIFLQKSLVPWPLGFCDNYIVSFDVFVKNAN